jgi:ATP-dependent helicase/DNAse subunit B
MDYTKLQLLVNMKKKALDYLILQKNTKSINILFSQAWEKYSNLTKEEAMKNYIELYNNVTNNNHLSFNNEDDELDLHLDNYLYSSTAKQAQKEIDDFLQNSSETERIIHKLKDKIYSGDIITTEYLINYSKENNFKCN